MLSQDTPPQAVGITQNTGSSNGYFKDATIRQTLHLTLAAEEIRIKLSNEFGTSPLEITASTAALTKDNKAGSADIDTDTLHKLAFKGKASVTIPSGGTVLSDPIKISTKLYQELTVSLYLEKGQVGKATTAHDSALADTWVGSGDQTKAATLQHGNSVTHWYYVTEVQANLPKAEGALVCVGDSITDGTGSDKNGNNRWVDDLFRRMQGNADTKNIAVLNAGIGGNHLVTTPSHGPTAMQRIKGILAQPGVRYVALLDAVNDIGTAADTDAGQDAVYNDLVKALTEIIDEVHKAGLPIFGGTLTPSFDDPSNSGYKSAYSSVKKQETRTKINKWILNSSKFDYIVDYASAVDSKTNPNQFQPQYAFTNYIHPNVAGHKAMADAWDLSVFKKFANKT